MRRTNKKQNQQLSTLIQELKKLAIEKNVNLWKRIATELEKPTRQRRIVNVYKINKYSKENETIIVPGKVLGMGGLDHKVEVAALSFSEEANNKISKSGKTMTINELMKKNPEAKGVRIVG